MGAALTVRSANPFLFSKAAAVFPTKETAITAMQAIGRKNGSYYRIYQSMRPNEVPVALEDIRSELRDKGFQFETPSIIEIAGSHKWNKSDGKQHRKIMFMD